MDKLFTEQNLRKTLQLKDPNGPCSSFIYEQKRITWCPYFGIIEQRHLACSASIKSHVTFDDFADENFHFATADRSKADDGKSRRLEKFL